MDRIKLAQDRGQCQAVVKDRNELSGLVKCMELLG